MKNIYEIEGKLIVTIPDEIGLCNECIFHNTFYCSEHPSFGLPECLANNILFQTYQPDVHIDYQREDGR